MPILEASADMAASLSDRVDREGIRPYIRAFWPQANPGLPYIQTWHGDCLGDHVEATFVTREIKRLVCCIPPRMFKSTYWSCLGQSYKWTSAPEHRFQPASFDLRLVERDAQRILDVVRSPLHQLAFPQVQLPGVQALKHLKTSAGGHRIGTSPKSRGATGWGAQTQVTDDPNKAQDVWSEKELERVLVWHSETMANRIDGDPLDFVRVVVMQRLAEMDLAGMCKEHGFYYLDMPMGERDAKGKWHDMLCERLYPAEAVEALASEMGSESAVQAQLLQNPVAGVGGYVETAWVKRFTDIPMLPRLARWFQVWDLSFKGEKTSQSRVAALLCFEWQSEVYVYDYVVGHKNFSATLQSVVEQYESPYWCLAGSIDVEDAANGPALKTALRNPDPKLPQGVQVLYRKIGALIRPVGTGGVSKEDRLRRETPKIQAGRLHVREGLEEVVTELVGFPNARYDDLTDCVAAAMATLDSSSLKQINPVLKQILGRR